MNGFFENDDKERNFFLWSAERLAQFIRSKTGYSRAISCRKWATELLKIEATEHEIEAVLSWYIDNARTRKLPQVASARTFVSHYKTIKTAMETTADPTEMARKISFRLGDLHWGKFNRKDELKTIQLSLDRYRAWRDELATFCESSDNWMRGLGLYVHSLAPPADLFVEQWMVYSHRIFTTIARAFRGDLTNLAFSASNPRFTEMCEMWAMEYMGPGDHWLQLKRLMYESRQTVGG